MKATDLQKKIIDICITELQCWKDSNDINSPTHNSDGEEALSKLHYENDFLDSEIEGINTALQSLRYLIIHSTKDKMW